jgi:hypothetical protein
LEDDVQHQIFYALRLHHICPDSPISIFTIIFNTSSYIYILISILINM